MDVIRIINSDGYKLEDLTKENRDIINFMRYLKGDIKDYADSYFFDSDDSIISQIKEEIVSEAFGNLNDWLELQIAEYQIALIESQDDV